MLSSIYAKEVRTKDAKINYIDVEVIFDDIPEHIKFLIPDAVKIVNPYVVEYLSRSSIEAIEMYLERDDD